MSRIDKAKVIALGEDFIEVRITEDGESCETCPMSKSCKAGIEVKIKAKDSKKFEIGQEIRIKVFPGRKLLLQSYIFIVPILALAVGVIFGSMLFKSEGAAVISGAVLFAGSLLLAIFTAGKKDRILYKLED